MQYHCSKCGNAITIDIPEPFGAEWLPIEIAPKRLQEYLLLSDTDGNMVVGRWNPTTGAWSGEDYNGSMTWPTHWMRLPIPPMGN